MSGTFFVIFEGYFDRDSETQFRTVGLHRSIFGAPILVVILLGVTARVIWTVRESAGRTAFKERLQALAEANVPIDDASAEALYLSRTDDSRTDQWLDLMQKLETEDFKLSQRGVSQFDPAVDEQPFAASGVWQPEAATRVFVDNNQPIINEIRELSRLRRPVTFPYYFDSINTRLPYAQQMREVGRMLTVDGQIALRDADSARVAADIQALFDGSIVCSEEPWMVSQLVCYSLDFRALDLLKLAVESDHISAVDRRPILALLLERSQLQDQWQKLIFGERSAAIPCFAEPSRVVGPNVPMRGWDGILFLDLMERALALDTANVDTLLASAREFNAKFEKDVHEASWLRTADSILTSLMAPAFGAMATAIARDLTEKRLAAHAISLINYRHEHGRWPADLDSLNLPRNQYDLNPPGGLPFGYRLNDDDTVSLWGFDLTDDSQTATEPPSVASAGEEATSPRWVWTLPAPARQEQSDSSKAQIAPAQSSTSASAP